MEVGSQTEPMDTQDILNLLQQKSLEMERQPAMSEEEDEIQSVEDGEVYFNSQNEGELKKNDQSLGKSTSTKSKTHPSGQTSLSDKICEAVWSRKDSSRSSTKSKSKPKKLVRSQSFSKGSSSTSSSLSPPKIHPVCVSNSTGKISISMDPYARRSSGCASYIIRSAAGNNPYSSRENLPTSSPKFDSSRVRRQISSTLSLPSREASVKSTSSKGGQSPVVLPVLTTSPCCGCSVSNPNAILPQSLLACNNFPDHQQFYRLGQGQASSSNCLVPVSSQNRTSRSSSLTQSVTGSQSQHPNQEENEDQIKERRQRKYVIFGFTFLLLVAVACVAISLGLSSRIHQVPGVDTIESPISNSTDDL